MFSVGLSALTFDGSLHFESLWFRMWSTYVYDLYQITLNVLEVTCTEENKSLKASLSSFSVCEPLQAM